MVRDRIDRDRIERAARIYAQQTFHEKPPFAEVNTVNELIVPKQDLTLSQMAATFAKSGYFKDAKDAAQACVKIIAGQEIGIGPMAAMTGIHIIEGKPEIGAALLARLIRQHPDYDYRVMEHTEEVCEIEFIRHGQPIGTERFTMDDAKRAQLAGRGPWKAYPRNMLFARAMSNGAAFHCPDATGLRLYHEGEIDTTERPAYGPPSEAEMAEVEFIEEPEEQNHGEPEPVPAYRVEMMNEIVALEKQVCDNPKHIENARKKYLNCYELSQATDEALSAYIDRMNAKVEEKKGV